MKKLTAVIITLNEEDYISDCLESLKWCAEVIVLDSYSTDRTVEIARQSGAQVVQRRFINFADQRNAGIDLVQTEWILFVDADERITSNLAEEIKEAIQDPTLDGYWIPRKNNHFGKWLKYGGFYPDYQMRLARKKKISYDPTQKVHEQTILSGNSGHLSNPIIHICYQNLRELIKANQLHSKLMAETYLEKGVKPGYHMITAPVFTFYDQYIVKQGFRDGIIGLLLNLSMSYYIFSVYTNLLKLRAREKKRKVN